MRSIPSTVLGLSRAAVRWFFHELPRRVIAVSRHRGRSRILLAACLAAFAALALVAVVDEALLLRIDSVLQDTAIAHRQGWLNTAMVGLTFLGTRWVIGAAVLGLVLWSLLTRRCRTAALVIVLVFALNPLLEFLAKEMVGRVRPDVWRLVPGNGPSFPSGHVLASVGFYGLMPLLVWDASRSYWARRAAFFASGTLITVVGISRVYLDVHWASDVVAGLLLGTATVLVSYRALRGHRLHVSAACVSCRV